MIRTAHLFSGAGGGLLADLILGHSPVLAVEIEKRCCDVLLERKKEGWFDELDVCCSDITRFDFHPWEGRVDCVSAGFPCQDISCAGTGAGIEGARSGLVWQVFRAIDAVHPGLVFLENSPQIRTRGRNVVLGELKRRGYMPTDPIDGTLSAADVGAPHLRDRWWCLAANADGLRKLQQERIVEQVRGWFGHEVEATSDAVGLGRVPWRTERDRLKGKFEAYRSSSLSPDPDQERRIGRPGCVGEPQGRTEFTDGFDENADTLRQRLQIAIQCGGLPQEGAETIQAVAGYTGAYHWSPPDSGICGMVDGLAAPMDGNPKSARIKALGNGQVPLAAAMAWVLLSEKLLRD